MESPVRISAGLLCLLFISLIHLEGHSAYPSIDLSSQNVTDENSSQESTTIISSREKSNASTLFRPRNSTWLYQRRNAFNITAHPSQQDATNSTGNSNDTTISYGNKINFRGSVRYFATRPPFKPKIPYLKRNNNVVAKSESSEKIESVKLPTIEKVKLSRNTYLSDHKPNYIKNDTKINNNLFKSTIISTTNKPRVSEKENVDSDSTIQTSTETIQNAPNNRSENSKSLNLDFNIDKYTSPEFHDVNNVYSQSISPEVEHFIVPENVSEYYVSVGSAPHARRENINKMDNRILTTPKTDLFDQRFKEVSESIKQNLADIEYINEENNKLTTERVFSDSTTDSVSFEKLLSKANDNNTKVSFKNTKELILTDSENSMSKHSDFTDVNGTNIFYESSVVSTETYDQVSSTFRTIPEETKQEITTSSPVLNEVINPDKTLHKKESNITKNIGSLKANETRKEFLSTIRMRIRTSPRPRMRISLKNKIETNPIPTTTERMYTTKSPHLVKMFPFTRRRNIKLNNTYSTTPSKLDPVYQSDTSPTRVAEHTGFDTENTIPILQKRGSLKYDVNNVSSTATSEAIDDPMPQFSIPPTATAWALISLKDTPGNKKRNGSQAQETISQQDVTFKAEDDLQNLLDKTTGVSGPGASSTNEQTTNNDEPTTTQSSNKNDKYVHEEIMSASKIGFTTITLPSTKNIKLDETNATKSSKSDLNTESITNIPNTMTTSAYESEQDSDASTSYFTSADTNYPTGEEDYETDTFTPKDSANEQTETTTDSYKTMNPGMNSKTDSSEKTKIYSGDKSSSKYSTDKMANVKTTTHISKSESEFYDRDDETSITTETTMNNDDSVTIPKVMTSNTINKEIKTTTDTVSTTDNPQSSSSNHQTDLSDVEKETYKVSIVTPTPMDMTDFVSEREMFSTKSTPYKAESKSLDDIDMDITSTMSTTSTTEDSNSVYFFTADTKNVSDLESASTVFYNSNNKAESTSTSSTVSKQVTQEISTLKEVADEVTSEQTSTQTTSERMFPSRATVTTKIYPYMTIPITSEENLDSREGKKTNTEEDKTVISTLNSLDQNDNLDEWLDSPDSTVDVRQLDSNEIPTNNANRTEAMPDQEGTDNDLTEYNAGEPSTRSSQNNRFESTTVSSTLDSNIEIIRPNPSAPMPDAVGGFAHETTPLYVEDMDKFEDSGDGSGAIAAITISVIGVIALVLLVAVLMVARGRRRSGGYGQRCTPVSLDSYSLDNVSISGSARRKARRPSKRSYGNPAYDESGATSHPMQFAALANFALDQDSIVNEFNEIPTISARADEVPPGCESKNRYSNVIPLPETRVTLKLQPGDETSDYINANYVRGPKNIKNYYIACQAPLSSTVNDFWRMIWEQNSRVILMLTEFMENGAEKCYEYLPPSEVSDSRRSYGDYQIVLKKREVRDKYIISVLQVKSTSVKVTREITHMLYFWPPKGVPEECHSIIAFLIEARSYLKASQNAKDHDEDNHQDNSLVVQNGGGNTTTNVPVVVEQDDNSNDNEINVYNVQKSEQKVGNKNGTAKVLTMNNNQGTEDRKKSGPLIVHCSPGTGRTGALIACDIGIRDFEMSRTVDIPKTVYRIRRDRANAVQTKDQYIFIYKVLSEYATKLTGGILDSI